MKVNLGTIEVDDDQRKLIAESEGGSGLATREVIRDTFVPNLIKAGIAALETASIEADSGSADASEPKDKKGKKGKKSKDVEPEPVVEEKTSKKDKKSKKGKKGKG